jgi:hypothetical protein
MATSFSVREATIALEMVLQLFPLQVNREQIANNKTIGGAVG